MSLPLDFLGVLFDRDHVRAEIGSGFAVVEDDDDAMPAEIRGEAEHLVVFIEASNSGAGDMAVEARTWAS